ncbi:MAG: glycosyltransferase [Chitinophagales bacterium]
MKKLLILADASSVHTIKWVNALLDRGYTINVFSLKSFNKENYPNSESLSIKTLQLKDKIFKGGEGALEKLKYLKAIPSIKKIINDFKPDILHAHYASSYGVLGALCGFHPFILSVWGSDIYDFPNHNFIFKKIIQYNLKKADRILSTSEVMGIETKKYTDKKVEITPFGVDTDVFKKREKLPGNEIVIGTVKALEHKYGIDTLLETFELLIKKRPESNFKLYIAGDGSKSEVYKKMAGEKQIADKVVFSGNIPNQKIPEYISQFDVYLALSRLDSESFGVAIVEAMACEVPVVVSNVGGLPEVVDHENTGFVVPAENPTAALEAIEKIIEDPNLAKQMGKSARKRVLEKYDWKRNVELMDSIYQDVLRESDKFIS